MKSKYTLSDLKNIAENSAVLEKEVNFSYGRILSLMEKENIYPPLDSLLSMGNMFGLPFILKNYSLDESQLKNLKERYNKNRVKELKINQYMEEEHLVKDFNLEVTSPEKAIYYLINNIGFKFTDLHDYDFFEKVSKHPDFKKDNIYLYQDFLDFFAHCTTVSLKNGKKPHINDRFIYFHDALKFSEKDKDKEYDSFTESEYFIEEKIRNFGNSNSLLLSDVPSEVISYGISKPLVLESLKKAFKRATKKELEHIELQFIFSIGYVDSFGASSVSDYLSNVDKKILDDTFHGMLPFAWDEEALKTPFVQSLIDTYLFDEDNCFLLNPDFKFPYKEENYDLVFDEKRIKKIVSTFQKKLPKRSHMNFIFSKSESKDVEFFIAKTYLKVFKFAAENDISIFRNKSLSIPFSFLFYLNEFRKDTPLFDIIKSTPSFFKFEYGNSLLGGLSNFKNNNLELKNNLKSMLSNPTVDNVLILANGGSSEFNDDVISMVAQLNPYDVNILKDILPLDFNLIGIEGNPNMPMSTAENSPYMRESAFSWGARETMNIILDSNPDNIKSLLEHLLSINERILSSNAIFDYIFENVSCKKDLNGWEDFLISYAKKFPEFIEIKEEQEKYLNLMPNLAKSVVFPIKNKTFDEKIELLFSKAGSDYWKSLSKFEKNEVVDGLSSDYKQHSKEDLDFMEHHYRMDYAKKIFYKNLKAFKEDEVMHSAFSNIIMGLEKDDLSYLTSKEHARFFFSFLIGKGRYPFQMVAFPNNLRGLYKEVMIEEFPELVSHKDIVTSLHLLEDEKKNLYKSMMKKDLNDVNFNTLLCFANNFDRKDMFVLSDDLIDILNSLPQDKQLIWMVVLSQCFVMPDMDKDVISILEKNLTEKEFQLDSYNTSLLFKVPGLHNVNELLSNENALNAYSSFTFPMLNKNLFNYSAKMSVNYKVNGNLEKFELNIAQEIANKIKSDNIDLALKEGDFQKLNSLFGSIDKLKINIVDSNIENLFKFLKECDKSSDKFITAIADNIKDSILSNSISVDNIENLIYASNIAASSSKKRNSFGFTDLELRLYSNPVFVGALDLYVKKSLVEDVFTQHFNGIDDREDEQSNNIFKI